jgi:glycosyltransferase involved in cell wall biosynthesis
MGCGTYILAHNNPFNRSVLEDWGTYWTQVEELSFLLQRRIDTIDRQTASTMVQRRAALIYTWEGVAKQYEALMERLVAKS